MRTFSRNVVAIGGRADAVIGLTRPMVIVF